MASDIKATYLTASGDVFAGRSRIKAIHYQAGTSPTLALKNGGSGGTTLLTMAFANATDDKCSRLLISATTAPPTNPSLRTALFISVPHHRLPDWFSSRGRTFAEMASRARKIRDRTVPMGQSMAVAISS